MAQFVGEVKDILRLESPKLAPSATASVEKETEAERIVAAIKEQASDVHLLKHTLQWTVCSPESFRMQPSAVS